MYTKATEDNDHATKNPIWADSPSIMGESGIVMEVSTGTILYEKNMHDIHYPASITKIMTVLLAIENCEMDEILTVPPEAVYICRQGEHIYQDTLELLNYGLDCFSKEKINEDKAFFEEMLKKENPIFENCVISKFDVDNSYVIIPKGLNISDMNIKFDYGEAETVTAQYFYENHLVGQIGFIVEGIQSESDSLENTVKEQLSEGKWNKGSLFNWKYIVFAIIVGALIAGVVLKVLAQKYCGRNKKNRSGRRLKRNGIRRKWR